MIQGMVGTYNGQARSPEIARCTDFLVLDMKDISNTGCEFDAGQTCVASLAVTVEVLNNVGTTLTYDWSFTPIAGVTDNGNHTDDTYTLQVTGDTDIDVEVKVSITDETPSTATHTQTFTVPHTQKAP